MTVNEELVSIAERLRAIAESLYTEKEETKTNLTLEEVRKVLVEKSRASKENQEAIKNILKNHGADTLSKLSPELYETVLEEVKTLDG